MAFRWSGTSRTVLVARASTQWMRVPGLLVVAAGKLASQRDFGAGLVPPRRGSANRPKPDARVEDVMDGEVVELPSSADLATTLRPYRDAARQSLSRRRPGSTYVLSSVTRPAFHKRACELVPKPTMARADCRERGCGPPV